MDILLDAGCDPRIKNGAKLRPIELADPRNDGLRNMLRRAEYSMMAGADVVEEDFAVIGTSKMNQKVQVSESPD